MSDRSSSHFNNSNVIYDWERNDEPLAPLSAFQRNVVLDLSQEIKQIGPLSIIRPFDDGSSKQQSISECSLDNPPTIETTKDFLIWYSRKEDDWLNNEDLRYKEYLESLEKRKDECADLLDQVNTALKNLSGLNDKYQEVSFKTNSLHQVSETLTNDQLKLVSVRDGIVERLNHFKALDRIKQALDTSMITVHSSNIESVLDQIDDHITYHNNHKEFKESWAYSSRYAQCLRKLLAQVRNVITAGLIQATSQASATTAGHYAKFLAAAHSIRPLIAMLEQRASVSNEYEEVLAECQQCYIEQRETLILPSVNNQMTELVTKGMSVGDHCALMRSACGFLIHISQDENKLYHQFFNKKSDTFTKYLESLCQSLYDTTRPIVIHMKHLETLAELCSILRMEMLQEHVSNNREALGAFGNVAEQLLQDVQERLVFRAHMYVQTDIAQYNPSPGDLAYPEKLHMMESIAQSLHQQELSSLSRSASLASLTSATSHPVSKQTPLSSGSPADLHGMWYPPVRRTLICLSRMYRCVDRPIFQGISQEALTACIASVKHASTLIADTKTVLDGEMFLIKHLLILREQIAPFQVDFTVQQMTLDFSKMKTAAVELVHHRNRLFSMNSNNALLQFLLEGTPQVKQNCLDSRKEVDRTLKAACETFIQDASNYLVGNQLVSVLEKGELWTQEGSKEGGWSTPTVLSVAVQASVKQIKANLPWLQATMHLYLANRDTEFILYRPIKNNVIGCFSKLNNLMSLAEFSEDALAEVGCPTPEQASILLSSASLESPETSQTANSLKSSQTIHTEPVNPAFDQPQNDSLTPHPGDPAAHQTEDIRLEAPEASQQGEDMNSADHQNQMSDMTKDKPNEKGDPPQISDTSQQQSILNPESSINAEPSFTDQVEGT